MAVSNRPFKPKPTNADLALDVREVHDCLHTLSGRVEDLAGEVRQDREDATVSRSLLGERMARLEGAFGIKLPSQAAMDAGETPKPVKTKLAGVSKLTAFFGLMGSMAGAAALYKIAEPVIIAAAIALRHALLAL